MWDNFEGDDCGTRNPGSQVGSMVSHGQQYVFTKQEGYLVIGQFRKTTTKILSRVDVKRDGIS